MVLDTRSPRDLYDIGTLSPLNNAVQYASAWRIGDRLRPLSKRSIATIFPNSDPEPIPKKVFIFITLTSIGRLFHKMQHNGSIYGPQTIAKGILTRVNSILEQFFNEWLTCAKQMRLQQTLALHQSIALGAAHARNSKGTGKGHHDQIHDRICLGEGNFWPAQLVVGTSQRKR